MKEYANEKKYELLSKFESVEEFNEHFEQAMLFHKDKFTKSEYVAINRLRKFAYSEKSLKTIGVSWVKAQKAVAATHKESLFGISRATFDRMLRKAKKLNLITVINQYRKKDNYQTHNVYVFNRLEELTPESFEVVGIVSKTNTIDESRKIESPITILLELPRLKDINTYSQSENVKNDSDSETDSEKPETDYQQLKKSIKGLFADKKITYKIYGVWLSQISKMKNNKPPFDLCISAIRALIAEIKRRRSKELPPLYNPAGYFSGTLSNMLDNLYEQQMQEAYETGFTPATITTAFNPVNEFKKYLYRP